MQCDLGQGQPFPKYPDVGTSGHTSEVVPLCLRQKQVQSLHRAAKPPAIRPTREQGNHRYLTADDAKTACSRGVGITICRPSYTICNHGRSTAPLGNFFSSQTSKQIDKHCRYPDGLDGESSAPWEDGMFCFVSVHLAQCAWVRYKTALSSPLHVRSRYSSRPCYLLSRRLGAQREWTKYWTTPHGYRAAKQRCSAV